MKRRFYSHRRRRKARLRFYVIAGVLIVSLAAGIYFVVDALSGGQTVMPGPAATGSDTVQTSASIPAITPNTPTPKPSLSADLKPHPTSTNGQDTNPASFGFTTDIMVDGIEVESYRAEAPITFGSGEEYTQLEGVTTFRGNNYRDLPSWGTADITQGNLTVVRTKQTGAIGSWGGVAWTGQPLVVRWPAELRSRMTALYEQFRSKENFTEVIIATLDGNVYFEELETGEKTRDAIEVGAPIKGSPSIDPRGYPILYVGQGVGPDGGTTDDQMYFRAFSLIDGKLLMKVGADTADRFAYRGWQAYDSSPLVDAETDTLIQPGENGVIYVCKLNTSYDPATGAVSMDMDPKKIKYRYTSSMNTSADKDAGGRWGIEDSIVAWRNYIFCTDNAGVLQCIDLNTMQLVYANDLRNDSDVTMVLEEDYENNTFYLYAACEYDDEVANKEPGQGTCYAYKINGLSGEIIWEVPYNVSSTDKDVDGGILASPILGKKGTSMSGLIIYTITKEAKDNSTMSRVIALDKLTGRQVWSYDMDAAGWSPSSPVPVYTADGQGYIVQCDIEGEVALIRVDGQTYEEVANIGLKIEETKEWNKFEATPIIFDNYIVVGSRSRNLFFIKIS